MLVTAGCSTSTSSVSSKKDSSKTDKAKSEEVASDKKEKKSSSSDKITTYENPEISIPEDKMTISTTPVVDISDIPSYSGSPYTEVNGNVPYFTDGDYSTSSFEQYSDLDSLGRCGTAIANIGTDLMPTEERGSIGMIKPSGWHTVRYDDLIEGKYLYNRCHLIGYQLTGENANEKNLITGTRYLNVDGMLPFENKVADYVKRTNNHVLYRVTPIFEGTDLVASGVLMEAYSEEDNGAGIKFNVYCYNVQPSIAINYATGDSAIDPTVSYSTASAPVAEASVPQQQTTPEPEPQPEVAPTTENNTEMVWIPNSGSKYHSRPSCSGMKNPTQVTLEVAIAGGYTPCKKCH